MRRRPSILTEPFAYAVQFLKRLSKGTGISSASLFAIVVAGLTCAPAQAQVGDAVQIYRACPVFRVQGARITDIDQPIPDSALEELDAWVPPASALPQHIAMWHRFGSQMPSGQSQLRLYEGFGHNVWNERSLVATRSSEGNWAVEEVLERDPGRSFAAITYARWSLAKNDGQLLDSVLADPCLSAEPARSSYPGTEIGGYIDNWTLEVSRPDGGLLFARAYSSFGRVGEIKSILDRGRPR